MSSIQTRKETGSKEPTKIVHDDLIKKWEGLRLQSYQDTGGVWTIGWGHTGTARPNQSISKAEAQRLFESDIAWAEKAVDTRVTVPLNQNQFDALVSFVFNVGESQFKRSTLLRVLNQGDYQEAADQFLRWVYDNGEFIQGLKNRRVHERQFFLS